MTARQTKTGGRGLRKVSAKKLTELRVAKPREWTEEELEAQSGVSRSTLVRIVTDPDYMVQPRTIQRLASALGVTPDELCESEPQKSSSLQFGEIAGRVPPGLDEWLSDRGIDVTRRQELELREVRIGFTREPPPNTNWRAFWDRIFAAIKLLDQATGDT